MSVTLRYEGGGQAVYASVEDALVQAAHDEATTGRRLAGVFDGEPNPAGKLPGEVAEAKAATESAGQVEAEAVAEIEAIAGRKELEAAVQAAQVAEVVVRLADGSEETYGNLDDAVAAS